MNKIRAIGGELDDCLLLGMGLGPKGVWGPMRSNLVCSLMLVGLAAVGCASQKPLTSPEPSRPAVSSKAPSVTEDRDFERTLSESQLQGAIVLFDVSKNAYTMVNPAWADKPFTPASTFKIPNTLIGLETGVIPDEHFTLKWSGQQYPIEAWNRDQDLASAMKHSVVWYYQEVARRIGQDRMQKYLHSFHYGNENTGGGIDKFWLSGDLRITPRQQIEFLSALYQGSLGVRPENVAIVKRITELGRGPGYVLRGKTGTSLEANRTVAWLVGALEHDAGLFLYATVLVSDTQDDKRLVSVRRPLTEQFLRRHQLLPAEEGR